MAPADAVVLPWPGPLERLPGVFSARRRAPLVLCYHGIGTPPGGADPHGLFIAPDRFRAHLAMLAGRDLVTLDEAWDRVQRPAGGGPAPVAFTFDDALAESVEHAAQIILGAGGAMTVYACSELLGQPHPDLGVRAMIASRAQLRELSDAGVQIGSHTVTHADLTAVPYATALDELRRSRAELEDITGRPVASLAYPYGRFNAQVQDAAREAGYETACACDGAGDWVAYAVPREPMLPSTGRLRMRAKIVGFDRPLVALGHGQKAVLRAVRRW
jgi:peptidoglycan/xylan/chitin deacetylase (PgdA/CDA1 family)